MFILLQVVDGPKEEGYAWVNYMTQHEKTPGLYKFPDINVCYSVLKEDIASLLDEPEPIWTGRAMHYKFDKLPDFM